MKANLPRFFLGVDVYSIDEYWDKIALVEKVPGDWGVKINIDMILKAGKSLITETAKRTGKKIFVDMKMWNGKRTMKEVFKAIAGEGATMTNVYALADSMLPDAVVAAKEAGLVVLGVTVLTHYDNDYCRKFHRMSMAELVRLLAETSLERGCDGYILPGTCLEAVKNLGGIKFNPATRPLWFKDKKANAQEQIMDPVEAFKQGADIVSCFSPVFKSDDPAEALARILEEIPAA